MSKVIEQQLEKTHEQYEMMVYNLWLDWCNKKTQKKGNLQKLLTCQPLFNWWRRELDRLEREYLKEVQPYKDLLDSSTSRAMYSSSVVKIYNRFSNSLIKQAKKQH